MANEPTFREAKQEGVHAVENAKWIINAARVLLMNLCTLGAFPVELLLHYRFGVRYLSILTYICSGFVIALAVAMMLPFARSGLDVALIAGFSTLFTGAFIRHKFFAWRRELRNIRWHSRCSGLPWPIWRTLPGARNPFTVQLVYEPLAVAAVGALLFVSVQSVFGVYLLFAAVALLFRQALVVSQVQAQVFDQIDQQIEAEVLADLVHGKRDPWSKESEGFVVPQVAYRYADQVAPTADDVIGTVEPKVSAAAERLAASTM